MRENRTRRTDKRAGEIVGWGVLVDGEILYGDVSRPAAQGPGARGARTIVAAAHGALITQGGLTTAAGPSPSAAPCLHVAPEQVEHLHLPVSASMQCIPSAR